MRFGAYPKDNHSENRAMIENNFGLIFALTLILLPTLGFLLASKDTGFAWSGTSFGGASGRLRERGHEAEEDEAREREYRSQEYANRETSRGIARMPTRDTSGRR